MDSSVNTDIRASHHKNKFFFNRTKKTGLKSSIDTIIFIGYITDVNTIRMLTLCLYNIGIKTDIYTYLMPIKYRE